MIIKDIINVVRAGNSLRNPEKWKRGHCLLSMVSLLVTGSMGLIQWKFPDLVFDEETQNAISQGICYVLITLNMYLIPATTEKSLAKPKVVEEPKAVEETKKPMKVWVNPNRGEK